MWKTRRLGCRLSRAQDESIDRRYAIMEEAMLKDGFEMLRMREAMRWTIPSLPFVALDGFWKVPMSPLIGAVCCGLLALTSPPLPQTPAQIPPPPPQHPR